MSINTITKWKGRSTRIVLFFGFFLLTSQYCFAEKTKWALGIGTGWLHDYPGAAQGRIRLLPFPVFRGSVFRVDRISGISGDVFKNSRVDFSWNFIFQFPTDSASIPVRQGMPDLDWLLSLGPQFKYYIHRSKHNRLFFRFPIRSNTCTNFSNRTRFCGVAFNPGFRHVYWTPEIGELTFRMELFSHSSEYQQYFYEVSPEYVTPTRKAFHARAGFLGVVYGFFHTYSFDGWELSTSANLYDYSLAINQESPLFVHKTNFGVFVAVVLDL